MRIDELTRADIEAFAAGELSPADAERVARAIAADEQAAAELEECLQLRALVAGAHADDQVPRGTQVISLTELRASRGASGDQRAARRRRAVGVATVIAVVAVAAIVFLLVRRESSPAADVAVAVDLRGTLAPNRVLVGRLAWPEADRHRPYDVARADATPREPLSFELLARIERLGDRRARVAAHLLSGDIAGARAVLRDAPADADSDSDRAALALATGDAEQALVHAAAALTRDPVHRQARWNRAAALERLELDASAAARYAEIAAGGEPGWAAEAAARMEAVAQRRQRREAASADADRAGQAFAAGGAPPLARVTGFPDRMRLYFYDALRTADSTERIQALRPIASALDAAFGEATLVALVDRVIVDVKRRLPLARRYAQMLATRDASAARSLVAAAADIAPDIALGALLYTGATPGVLAVDQLERYQTLAERSGDPWFALAVVEQRASLLLLGDDAFVAEAALSDARARCAGGKLVLRCQRIGRLLVHANLALQRIAPARALIAELLVSARQTSSPQLETNLLMYAHQAARRRDDAGTTWHAIADAFLEEWAARDGTCAAARTVVEERAAALFKQGRLDEARAALGREASCAAPPSVDGLLVRAYLATEVTAPALLAAVAALRRDARPAHEQTFLDHVEGRLRLIVDPAGGRALLHRTIAGAAGSEGVRARTYSYDALVEDAGARGAWSDALALFREEAGGGAATCVLAVRRDRRVTWIAADVRGRVTGLFDDASPSAPSAIARVLAGCASVEVLAGGAFHGAPQLLPGDRAWYYRVNGPPRTARTAPTGRTLVVADPRPPARLGLPALAPFTSTGTLDVLDGNRATPNAVLAAMQDAGYVEIHAHGMLAAEGSDPAFLALSPDEHGDYALTARAVERARFVHHPVVVLAACHAASAGPNQHRTWGLADAFVAAGARAVIASPGLIADAAAPRFFAAVRAAIDAGAAPSVALRDERERWTEPAQRAWIDSLVVFEASKEGAP